MVAVQPKPLAVLRHLAARPGQVVTKTELLKEVWAGTYVTQAVLKVAVRALREALGESADSSALYRNVGRDGYRFLGKLPVDQIQVSVVRPQPTPGSQLPTPFIVGREAELAQLHRCC